jgi:hypothetical protein
VSKIVCVGACIDRILQFMRPHNGVMIFQQDQLTAQVNFHGT